MSVHDNHNCMPKPPSEVKVTFKNPRRTPARTPPGSDGGHDRINVTLLRKGATFHCPTSPSNPSATGFQAPSLPRRSQTTLDDVIEARRRRIQLNVGAVEDCLNAPNPSTPSRSLLREGLSVSRTLLENQTKHTKDSDRHRLASKHRDSDSGLGTSIASGVTTPSKLSSTAITRWIRDTNSENHRSLSQRAFNRVREHILKPLLAKPSLKELHPIVLECPKLINDNQIVCLRDLEKTLISMAPGRTKSAELYFDFCMFSIRCLQATVGYFSDRELTRPYDRPYNHGYFIDLGDQIRRYAAQLRTARERQAGEDYDMSIDPYESQPTAFLYSHANLPFRADKIELMGGLSQNGRPAELVRVKRDGKSISLRTEKPVEKSKAPTGQKRSMSKMTEPDEGATRSMGRRKKNPSPEELAPKKCTEPGCNKEFRRPCDLTKHEKTHSRPWKCPDAPCKFHNRGFPTQKEMERHYNDKHNPEAHMFKCHFPGCASQHKRVENLKQHMERAHGEEYIRTKGNGKHRGDQGGSRRGSKVDSSVARPSTAAHTPIQASNGHGENLMTPPEDPMSHDYSNVYVPACPLLDDQDFFDPDLTMNMDISVAPEVGRATDYMIEDHQVYHNPSPEMGQARDYGYHDISPEMGQVTDYGYQITSPEIPDQWEELDGYHVRLPSSEAVFTTMPAFADRGLDTWQTHDESVSPISSLGEGNTMLFTPTSLADVDESFDDFTSNAANDQGDWQLYPPGGPSGMEAFDNNLFPMMSFGASAAAGGGESQPSSQGLYNPDCDSVMDWAAAGSQ